MRFRRRRTISVLVVCAMILCMFYTGTIHAVSGSGRAGQMYRITCDNPNVIIAKESNREQHIEQAQEGDVIIISPQTGYAIVETPSVETSDVESGSVEQAGRKAETRESAEINSDSIEITSDGDGGYRFVMPAAAVNIHVRTRGQLPTASPSETPSDSPTTTPVSSPTVSPSETPTVTPGTEPTASPGETPSDSPTSTPVSSPTASPGETPTVTPGTEPTASPSSQPTAWPNISPVPVPQPTSPAILFPSAMPKLSETPSPTPGVKSRLTISKTSMSLYAYCKVKSNPKKGIYVPAVHAKEKIKASYDSKDYTVRYSSSNSKVASVDKNGVVKGVKMGKATITVFLYKKNDTKKACESRTVSVTVKPTIYMNYLTGKKYVSSGGKKFTNKRGIRFCIVGADKPFYLFYQSGKKKYTVYANKKWKKNTGTVPVRKKTWIPLSGKRYKFFVGTDKNRKSVFNSNVIVWKI